MADGKIEIETKIDSTGIIEGTEKIDKSLQNVQKESKKLETQQKKNTAATKDQIKTTDKLKTAFNELGGNTASLANHLSDVASGGGAAVAAIVAATKAAKGYAQLIRDTSEAYKIQTNAETALYNASRNNPYLNNESVENLKTFASELQNASNLGDEMTLGYMAQLAAAGRTQEEIQNIIQASADIAASGAMSFESAVRNLNKTYSGLSGELGESIPQVKALTAEQLKNGDAVKVVGDQYKGFADKLKDTRIQASNAKGDLMESLGKLTKPTADAWDKWWLGFYNKGIETIEKINSFLGKIGDNRINKNLVNQIDTNLGWSDSYSEMDKYFEAHREIRASLTAEQKESMQEYLESQKTLSKNEQIILRALREQNKAHKDNVAAVEKEKAEKAAIIKANETSFELEKEKTADDYAKENNKALAESLKALEIEAKAKGESVKAQDKYNVYLQSYINLLTKTEDKIKEGFPVESKRRQQLEAARKELDESIDEETRLKNAIELTTQAIQAINDIQRDMSPAESLDADIQAIEDMKKKIMSTSDEAIAEAQKDSIEKMSKADILAGLDEAEKQTIQTKVNEISQIQKTAFEEEKERQESLLELEKEINKNKVLSEQEKDEAIKKLDIEYRQSKKNQLAQIVADIQTYTDQTVQIAQQAAELRSSTLENQTQAELNTLEIRYRKGEIGEDEYNEKITEIKKDAAKEQYKIDMFTWSASLLQATANIAEGVTKAIAQGGVAGIITGALVGAAGAVQLASIGASKPIPPSFQNGGVIGGINGATAGSDNTYIHARNGELVLNAETQAKLWNKLNSNNFSGSGYNMDVIINNSASNLVRATPQISREKIELMIDARVNESLKSGRYNDSLTAANNSMSGTFYGM
jgi:hypothetical protein